VPEAAAVGAGDSGDTAVVDVSNPGLARGNPLPPFPGCFGRAPAQSHEGGWRFGQTQSQQGSTSPKTSWFQSLKGTECRWLLRFQSANGAGERWNGGSRALR